MISGPGTSGWSRGEVCLGSRPHCSAPAAAGFCLLILYSVMKFVIVCNLVTPPQSISFLFSCFSFPAVNFPYTCGIWMEAGTVLILQVNGEAPSSQQIFLEHLLCVRHLCQVQGKLSSRSFCTRKCRQLQLESYSFTPRGRRGNLLVSARERMFPG